MKLQDKHIELFDRYVRNQLNGQELLDFEASLENDASLKTEFEQYRTMVEGVKDFERLRLKAFIKENDKSLHVDKRPTFKKFFYLAASLLLLFMISALIRQSMLKPKDNNLAIAPQKEFGDDTTSTIAHTNLDSVKVENIPAKPQLPEASKPEVIYVQDESKESDLDDFVSESDLVDEKHDAYVGPVQGTTNQEKSIKISGAPQTLAKPKIEEYNVLSDKKIKDTTVYPVLITVKEPKKKIVVQSDYPTVYNQVEVKKIKLPKNKDNNKTIPEKEVLVDSAMVSIPSSESKTGDIALNIQFWTSPVNFKGYNYVNNTVQLYGLSPNNARLFILKNVLYLRIDGVVYVLSPCSNSCAYKLEPDNEIVRIILLEK